MTHSARILLLSLACTLSAVAPATAQRIKLPVPVEELEKIALIDSTDAVAHYNLAIGYWTKGKFAEAEHRLRQALSLDGRLAPAHLALHYLPFARNPELWNDVYDPKASAESLAAIEEAERHYRHAFLIDPLVDMTVAGAALPKKSGWWLSDDELMDFYDAWAGGFENFLHGRYQDAHSRLHRLREDFERNRFSGVAFRRSKDRIPETVLWYHAIAAAHIGQMDEAVRDVEILLGRAARKEATDSLVRVPLGLAEYRYLLAALLHRAGQLERAVPIYREALADDAGLYMANVQLAEIFQASGDLSNAVAQRRAAVNANPDDAGLLVDLALTLIRAKEYPRASEALEQASAMNPKDPRPLYPLGILYIQLGRKDDARATLERFVEIAPSRFAKSIADARARIPKLF